MGGKEMFSELNKIYTNLGDDLSKEIFEYRMLYSISKDRKYVEKIMRTNPQVNEVLNQLENIVGDIVIYGAGNRGTRLVELMPHMAWKCFIDGNPKVEKQMDIPVISTDDFLKKYKGEWIVVSSRIYGREMKKTLVSGGGTAIKDH